MAAAQAIALRRVADDLQDSLNRMTRSGSPNPITEKEQVARVSGYFLSTVILRALATELMLKVLCFKKAGRYRKDREGHDLLVLFNDLDSDTRKLIADLERSHGIAPLQQILEKHRGDFVDWRYLMEAGGKHVDLLDLDKALIILMATYTHKDFHRLCAS